MEPHEPERHARRTDPSTSHEAVPRNITAQMLRILEAYRPGDAILDYTAYFRVGMTQSGFTHQRCSDLLYAGLIEDTGAKGRTPTGKRGRLCRITRFGKGWLGIGNDPPPGGPSPLLDSVLQSYRNSKGTTMNMMQPPEQTPAELIKEYVWLRDEKKRSEALFDDHMKQHYGEPMREIEAKLLDTLNKLESDSIATDNGTAYKQLSSSVTVADMREFRRHVIGSEEWGLADWRANKTAIEEMLENGVPLPPGVNRSAFYTVRIRRS